MEVTAASIEANMSEVCSETRKMVPPDRTVSSYAVAVLFHTEYHRGLRVVFKITLQLAHFLFRVLMHRLGQRDLFCR